MEPEGSSPHSQETATSPYPEPDKSIPCPHPTSRGYILILSSYLRLGLSASGFPTKTLYKALLYSFVLHAPPITFFSILSTEQYLVRSTDHNFLVM